MSCKLSYENHKADRLFCIMLKNTLLKIFLKIYGDKIMTGNTLKVSVVLYFYLHDSAFYLCFV
jgi:hypothetical protein